MDEQLLIGLLKIIKSSKKEIVLYFSESVAETEYVDFDDVLEKIEKYTKNLARTIQREAPTFNQAYESEEQMLSAVEKSFSNIHNALSELTTLYRAIKKSIPHEKMEKMLSLKVAEKLLNDYMLWCEKLENALLGIGNTEVIFMPDIILEGDIINAIANSTTQKSFNRWLPFLGGIAMGFILDDE